MPTVIEELVLAFGYKIDAAALDRHAEHARSNARQTEADYKRAALEVEMAQKRLAAAVDDASKAAAKSALDAATESRDAAKAALEDMGRDVAKLEESIAGKIGGALKGIALGFGAAAAAGGAALGSLVVHGIEQAKELDVTANKLGLNVTELQRLEQAAMASDGSAEAMRKTIAKLRENLGELQRTGAGPAKESLGSLGIELSQIANLPVERQLGLIGDALNGIEDPAKRTSTIMKLLGEDGIQLQTTLRGGTDGIIALGDAAEAAGNVLEADMVASAVRVEDKWRIAKTQLAAVGVTIFEGLLPGVEDVATKTGDWISENEQLLRQDLPNLMRSIASSAGELIEVFAAVARGIGSVRDEFQEWKADYAKDDTIFGAIDRGLLGLQNKRRTETGAIVDQDSTELKYVARAAIRRADEAAGNYESTDAFTRENVNREAVDREYQALREAQRRRGLAEYEARQRQARSDKYETAARKAAAGGGGGGKGKTAEQRAAEQALADAYVQLKLTGVEDELRDLGVRSGASDLAVQSALKAAAESAAKGTSQRVYRKAGVGSLSGSVGYDLSAKQTDPVLSALFGSDQLPDVPLSQIDQGQQPQVLIATINNTYTVEINNTIDGAREPRIVADNVGDVVRSVLRDEVSKVSKFSKVVFDR